MASYLSKFKTNNFISIENINTYYSESKPLTSKDWAEYFKYLRNNGIRLDGKLIEYFTKNNYPYIPTINLNDGSKTLKENRDYKPPFYRDKQGKLQYGMDILDLITKEGYGNDWLNNIHKYTKNNNPKEVKSLPSKRFGWIPLVSWSEHGVHPLMLDMDPASGGKVGQLIYVQLAEGYLDITLVADSWNSFINKLPVKLGEKVLPTVYRNSVNVVERIYGVKLPNSLKEYLRTNTTLPTLFKENGEVINNYIYSYYTAENYSYRSIEEGLSDFYRDWGLDELKESWVSGESPRWKNNDPGVVKGYNASNKWISLISLSISTDELYPIVIDFDPDKGGKVGQILLVQHVEGYVTTMKLADSFDEYLNMINNITIK